MVHATLVQTTSAAQSAPAQVHEHPLKRATTIHPLPCTEGARDLVEWDRCGTGRTLQALDGPSTPAMKPGPASVKLEYPNRLYAVHDHELHQDLSEGARAGQGHGHDQGDVPERRHGSWRGVLLGANRQLIRHRRTFIRFRARHWPMVEAPGRGRRVATPVLSPIPAPNGSIDVRRAMLSESASAFSTIGADAPSGKRPT